MSKILVILLVSMLSGCFVDNSHTSIPDKNEEVIEDYKIVDIVTDAKGVLEISNKERTIKYRKETLTKIVSAYDSDSGYEEISVNVVGQDRASVWVTKDMDKRLKILNAIDTK
jgi:hypothetical protein